MLHRNFSVAYKDFFCVYDYCLGLKLICCVLSVVEREVCAGREVMAPHLDCACEDIRGYFADFLSNSYLGIDLASTQTRVGGGYPTLICAH